MGCAWQRLREPFPVSRSSKQCSILHGRRLKFGATICVVPGCLILFARLPQEEVPCKTAVHHVLRSPPPPQKKKIVVPPVASAARSLATFETGFLLPGFGSRFDEQGRVVHHLVRLVCLLIICNASRKPGINEPNPLAWLSLPTNSSPC